jgi:hypothetical protein
MSDAWAILEGLGLDKLLLGQAASFDASALLNALLKERKLQEFLSVITHQDDEVVGAMNLEEAVEAITDFFAGITGGLKGLSGLGVSVKAPDPAAPTAKQKKPASE